MNYLRLSLFFLIAIFSLNAELIETNDINHATEYVEEETLFIFDLDNTLIETAQHLGSDQWFSHQFETHLAQGNSVDQTLEKLVPKLAFIYEKTEMRLVDPCIPDLLNRMKAKNVRMFALTKRDPAFASLTLKQLSYLEIDFSQAAGIADSFIFDELAGSLYKNGVIFIANNGDKGHHIEALYHRLEKKPKRIVMIDDKMSHVESVARAASKLNLPFVGIRYGGADERVKNFNPNIADLQWNLLHKIISDEEAHHLMQLSR